MSTPVFHVGGGSDRENLAAPPMDWDRAKLLGLGGAAATGLLTWLLMNKSSTTAKILGTLLGAGLGGTLAGGGSLVYDMLQGTPYDTENYKAPTTGGSHVVIGVSGAGDGPGGTVDRYLRKKYGKGNFAMFRWNDSDKYEKFLRSLPKGTKVTVHSHSYGVPTAMRGIKNTGVPVDALYTGDPVSWTERVDEKPANVKSWKNFLPSTLNPSVGYNWVAHLGGRWGSRTGAENIEAVPVDGEEVGHGSYGRLLGDR